MSPEQVLAHGVVVRGLGLGGTLESRAGESSGACYLRVAVHLSGPPELLADAGRGLPLGTAHAEAVAARLRRAGAELGWGDPLTMVSLPELLDLWRERGKSSIAVVRADPSLLVHLDVGGWFRAGWRLRLARGATHRLPPRALARLGRHGIELALEAAFWAGVRAAATEPEWRELTQSSYVALYYHRIAGEDKPGEERLDVAPGKLDSQLRLLRLLRFSPLPPDELLDFHAGRHRRVLRRRYVVTADDGFRDAARALRRHADLRPQLFVPTQMVGDTAPWAKEAPIASWDELRMANSSGVAVGSHTRRHVSLPGRAGSELDDELTGSLADLEMHLPDPLPLLAYPHGRHNSAVRAAAAAAGYAAAYSTTPGRNGAGTDPYQLHRIGVKAWDSGAAFLWKVVTGEHLPAAWERRLLARHRRRRP